MIVDLKSSFGQTRKSGWMERKKRSSWEKRWFTLTDDEIFHSADPNSKKKVPTRLASCKAPAKQGEREFLIETDDGMQVMRCADVSSRDAWFGQLTAAVAERSQFSGGQSVMMFDPTKHMQDENSLKAVELLFEPRVEAVSSATAKKSRFKKDKKPTYNDVVVHMTIDGISICDPIAVETGIARALPDNKKVVFEKDDELLTFQVTGRYDFRRIKTWALEQDGTCCRVEMNVSPGAPPIEFRFYTSGKTQATEIMDGIQRCIASLMVKKKRDAARKDALRVELAAILGKHDPDRLSSIDIILGDLDAADRMLAAVQAEYGTEPEPEAEPEPEPEVEPEPEPAAELVPVIPPRPKKADKQVKVTIEESGPMGIAFGADSPDMLGWIADVIPGGSASKFPELIAGLILTHVQEKSIASHSTAVEAIKAAGRPLTLTFKVPPSGKMDVAPLELQAGADEILEGSAPLDSPGSPRGGGRWILRYGSKEADEAIEVVQLKSYNVETPGTLRAEYAYEAIIKSVGHDGNVHTMSVGIDDVHEGSKFAKKLCKHAAPISIDKTSRVRYVTEAQEALLNSDGDISSGFQMLGSMDSMRENMSVRESFRDNSGSSNTTSSLTQAAADYLDSAGNVTSQNGAMIDVVAHYHLHIEQLIGTLGMGTYDICQLQMENLCGDFAHTEHGALALNAELGSAILIDQHSRSSVFGSLITPRASVASTDLQFDCDVSSTDEEDIVKSGSLSRDGRKAYYKLVASGALAVHASEQADSLCSGALKLAGATIDCSEGDTNFFITQNACQCELQAESVTLASEWKAAIEGCIEVAELLGTDLSSGRAESPSPPGSQEPLSMEGQLSTGSAASSPASSPSGGRAFESDPDAAASPNASFEPGTPLSSLAGETPRSSSNIFDGFGERSYAGDGTGDGEPLLRLCYEVTRWPPILSMSNEPATSLTVTLQPLQVVLNAVLMPLFIDFFDFSREFAGSSNFSLAKLFHVYHNAASASGERRRLDVRIRAPEIVIPESVDASANDALLLVARCEDIAIQNDFSQDADAASGMVGISVDKFAFSAVDQSIFTCARSQFLKLSGSLDALVTKETLLSPLTLAATVRWAPDQIEASASRLSIQCNSEAIQLRLSSKAVKSLIIIAAHVGEAIVPKRSSLAGLVKLSLNRDKDATDASVSLAADAEHGKTLGEKLRAYMKSKVTAKAADAGSEPASEPKTPHTISEDMFLDFEAEAAEAAHANASLNERSLTHVSVELSLVDVTIVVDDTEFGVQGSGLSYAVQVRNLDWQTKWSLEKLEIVRRGSSDAATEPPTVVEPVFSSNPSLGLNVVRRSPGSPFFSLYGGDTATVVHAFHTANPSELTRIAKPADLMAVSALAPELRRMVPVVGAVVGELQRAAGPLAGVAAKVGISRFVPATPRKIIMAVQAMNPPDGAAAAPLPPAILELKGKLQASLDQAMSKLPTSFVSKVTGGGGNGGGGGGSGSIVAGMQQLASGETAAGLSALAAVLADLRGSELVDGRGGTVGKAAAETVFGTLETLAAGGSAADSVVQLRGAVEKQAAKLEAVIRQEVETRVAAITGVAATQIGELPTTPAGVIEELKDKVAAQVVPMGHATVNLLHPSL